MSSRMGRDLAWPSARRWSAFRWPSTNRGGAKGTIQFRRIRLDGNEFPDSTGRCFLLASATSRDFELSLLAEDKSC
jgi:hypothetical protein